MCSSFNQQYNLFGDLMYLSFSNNGKNTIVPIQVTHHLIRVGQQMWTTSHYTGSRVYNHYRQSTWHWSVCKAWLWEGHNSFTLQAFLAVCKPVYVSAYITLPLTIIKPTAYTHYFYHYVLILDKVQQSGVWMI